MRSLRPLALFAALWGVALAALFHVGEARSSGVLSKCDLTPYTDHNQLLWTNGCIGRRLGFRTCDDRSDLMGWANEPLPYSYYTLRSGDANGMNTAADPKTYIPGGYLNELHIRTYNLTERIVGLLLYATTGVDPATSRERQVGNWTVLPAQGGAGFQVSASCGFTAVTHKGADVKPLHTRLWWSAPVGTGTVTFRILLKIGGQGTGYFAYPKQALQLNQGTPPPVRPVNKAGATPVAITPLSGDGVRVNVLGAPGQSCAEACYAQVPASPYCHARAIVNISSEATFLAAAAGLVNCDLPVLGICPYAGAPRTVATQVSKQCRFRSTNTGSSMCAAWALKAISAATAGRTQVATVAALFGLGTSTSANRTSPVYVPDVCYTAPTADAQNLCVCTNNPKHFTNNVFSQALLNGVPKTATSISRVSRLADENEQELPEGGVQERAGAASSRVSGVAASILLVLLSSLSAWGADRASGSRALPLLSLCLVAVLSLAAVPASAHNMMRSLHRAQEASVAGPCQKRIGNQPHVQVGPNQPFEMEWGNGHGTCCGKFYFVMLHSSAYDKLNAENITDIIADYLDRAPLSAFRNQSTDAAKWERHHLLRSDRTNPDYYWKEPRGMPTTDPAYIAIDAVYASKKHPSDTRPQDVPAGHTVLQQRFNDKWKPNDRRAVYKSNLYPWIESVDEFPNPYNANGQDGENDFYSHHSDIARFSFPARNGPGDYIAWYYWSGYRDCVDINVPVGVTTVANRYGSATTTAMTAIKVDHCELRYVQHATTPMRLLDRNTRNVTRCIADCIAAGSTGCKYVQAVRRTNPARTFKTAPNIPWAPYLWNDTRWAIQPQAVDWPCSGISPQNMIDRGCKRTDLAACLAKGQRCNDRFNSMANTNPAQYPTPRDDDYFCYGTIPYRDEGAQVYEDYVIATDPLDPVWYSTCYMMTSTGGFINIPAVVPTTAPTWTTDGGCIRCDFYAQALANRMDQISFWDQGLIMTGSTTGECTDCSLLRSTASTLQAGIAQLNVGADRYWVGFNGSNEKAAFVKAGGSVTNLPVISSRDEDALGSDPVPGDDGTETDGAAGGGHSDPAGGGSDSSSSSSQLLGMKTTYGVLLLVGLGLAVLLLAVGAFFLVRRRKLAALAHLNQRSCSTQMTSNPVAGTEFQKL